MLGRSLTRIRETGTHRAEVWLFRFDPPGGGDFAGEEAVMSSRQSAHLGDCAVDVGQRPATALAIGRSPVMTENVLPIVLGAVSVSTSVAATSPRLTLP